MSVRVYAVSPSSTPRDSGAGFVSRLRRSSAYLEQQLGATVIGIHVAQLSSQELGAAEGA